MLFYDSDALHKSVADELTAVTEKTTLNSNDLVLIEDSEASNAKKKAKLTNVVAAGVVFGRDYQAANDESESSTTSNNWQLKLSFTTSALTGTYRVNYYSEVASSGSNKDAPVRLYNNTDATEMCLASHTVGTANSWNPATGYANVVFTGAAKTFYIQWSAPGSTTVTIRRARVSVWRVA